MAEQIQQQIDPKTQRQMDSYIASLMHIMHNPKTSGNIIDMLKQAPPEESIPFAALQINAQVESAFAKKTGGKVDDSIKLAGAMYLSSDLIEIGNASGIWDRQLSEKDVPKMFQSIATKYIHQGLKDGSIDPIKLQRDTEPLLNEKQRSVGMAVQQQLGLPDQPTASMGVDALVKKKVTPLEEENAKLKSLLQQQGQAQVQQQQQQPSLFMQMLQGGTQ